MGQTLIADLRNEVAVLRDALRKAKLAGPLALRAAANDVHHPERGLLSDDGRLSAAEVAWWLKKRAGGLEEGRL